MNITNHQLKKKIEKLGEDEILTYWGTTVQTIVEHYRTSSPHISVVLKPTFGKITMKGYQAIFYPEKVNGTDFKKTGRNADSLHLFEEYEDAVKYYNDEISKFIKIKHSEIKSAEELYI